MKIVYFDNLLKSFLKNSRLTLSITYVLYTLLVFTLDCDSPVGNSMTMQSKMLSHLLEISEPPNSFYTASHNAKSLSCASLMIVASLCG